MEADKKWYVIHTYSGYENKVKTTLELKVQSMGLQDVISRILVPLEDEIDEKDVLRLCQRTLSERLYDQFGNRQIMHSGNISRHGR